MTRAVAQIWRHPIKAIGREQLTKAHLSAGQWLPGDRLWAVAHARSKPMSGWMPKINFLRGVTEPQLMAVTATYDEASSTVTLAHPTAGQITLNPDDAAAWPAMSDWLSTLWPAELPAPSGLVRQTGVHMTDVPDPWISLHSLSSHRAVQDRVGQDMSIHRWRGNIWLDGLGPWEEFEWIGRHIRLGQAVLKVETRITRCKATMANPETGRRDIDTLAALGTWDHQDFGVYAAVVESGPIATGDPVEVLSQ